MCNFDLFQAESFGLPSPSNLLQYLLPYESWEDVTTWHLSNLASAQEVTSGAILWASQAYASSCSPRKHLLMDRQCIILCKQNCCRDFFSRSKVVYVPFGSRPFKCWCHHWIAESRIILGFTWGTEQIDIYMSYLLILLLSLPGLMTMTPMSNAGQKIQSRELYFTLWTMKVIVNFSFKSVD